MKNGYELMSRCTIKDVKRCPSCNSSNIYRRSRTIQIRRNKKRKDNKNFIEERVKHYRCNICKHEFDSPIIEQIMYIQKCEERIW